MLKKYKHSIIRHGPKAIVGTHLTGREAKLDETKSHLIYDYFAKQDVHGSARIDTLGLERNYKTAEIGIEALRK